MGPDRLDATLVSVGALLGLVVMTPIALTFPFALFAEIAFALVLLLGVALFSRPSAGRALAAGAAWFAVFGGAVNVAFLLLGLIVSSGSLVTASAIGVVAMGISVAGALVKLRAPL